MNWLQKLHLLRFSKPASDRPLWAFLLENPISSILQLGMGDGAQTRQMLQLARCPSSDTVLRFAAIDLFESATPGTGHLRLKDAHRMCAESGVKAHLIPGDLKSALPRLAVTVLPSDLVIVNLPLATGSADEVSFSKWLPRLIHPSSRVMATSESTGKLEFLGITAISQTRQAA